MMFFCSLISGTLITISSYTWISMWMGLEINLLSIFPLMKNTKNILSVEASIKYLITQVIASALILLMTILMMNHLTLMSLNIETASIMMMNSALLTKMGAAPFHFWFPEVMEMLSWLNCMLILTWQKVAPMIMVMYNPYSTVFLSMIIVISMMISGFMSFNQISLRKILTYSSINHIGWMISSIMLQETVWIMYFLIYTITTIALILMMKMWNLSTLNQLFEMMAQSTSQKMMFMINFFSFMGVPPFLGFFPKWLIIQTMISENLFMITTIMVTMTLIMIFVYMRILLTSLIMVTNKSWNNMMISNKMKTSIMNFISIMSLVLCTMSFNLT
uniref:NADH-ubiquinone oxidoreductase chain 2 n=1 Tax=Melasis buprestoides TaxID=195231 RepID=A0A343C375_9COLE|nr:NADH dehydrogenase subunit 2 [Melasis buprestoides]